MFSQSAVRSLQLGAQVSRWKNERLQGSLLCAVPLGPSRAVQCVERYMVCARLVAKRREWVYCEQAVGFASSLALGLLACLPLTAAKELRYKATLMSLREALEAATGKTFAMIRKYISEASHAAHAAHVAKQRSLHPWPLLWSHHQAQVRRQGIFPVNNKPHSRKHAQPTSIIFW